MTKTKLAFDLLEQEMEVICKEEQVRFTGGSGGYTWQQIMEAINSGNIGQIPTGSYVMSSSGDSFTFFGGELNEVIVSKKSPAASSSSGFVFWDWSDQTGGSGSFWFSSNGYVDGGGSSGGGSNTTLDSNFRFDPEDNYEILFPEFTKTVNNLANYVSSNPKVMETLKQYTGLNETQILEKLTSDQGPTVKIHQLDGNYGFHNPFTNTIEVDIDYVNQLEYSTGEKGEVLNLMLTITLLHEFVHWTDGLFFDYTQENGNNWEIATYGFVVNMGNVTLVKL